MPPRDPTAYDPEIGSRLPCGDDNLSCPRLDGVLECYNRSMLCDDEVFCMGGSDEGQDLVALNCKYCSWCIYIILC